MIAAARRGRWTVALLLASLLWFSAILLGPVAASSTPRTSIPFAAAGLTYMAGRTVCHQQGSRSFHLAGAPLPVCARCTGVYAGVLAGAGWAVWRRRPIQPRRARPLLVAVAAPTIVTVATAWAGWWDPPNVTRSAIAWPLGAVVAWVVAAALDWGLE